MAGKGRGIAAFTFNIDALGLTRGSMPETQHGPQPLFPVSSQNSRIYLFSIIRSLCSHNM